MAPVGIAAMTNHVTRSVTAKMPASHNNPPAAPLKNRKAKNRLTAETGILRLTRRLYWSALLMVTSSANTSMANEGKVHDRMRSDSPAFTTHQKDSNPLIIQKAVKYNRTGNARLADGGEINATAST